MVVGWGGSCVLYVWQIEDEQGRRHKIRVSELSDAGLGDLLQDSRMASAFSLSALFCQLRGSPKHTKVAHLEAPTHIQLPRVLQVIMVVFFGFLARDNPVSIVQN